MSYKDFNKSMLARRQAAHHNVGGLSPRALAAPTLYRLKPNQLTISEVVSRNIAKEANTKVWKTSIDRLKSLVASRNIDYIPPSPRSRRGNTFLQSKLYTNRKSSTPGLSLQQPLSDIMSRTYRGTTSCSSTISAPAGSTESCAATVAAILRPKSRKPNLLCKGTKLDPLLGPQRSDIVPEQQYKLFECSATTIPSNVTINDYDSSAVPPLQLPTRIADDAPTSDKCSIINLSIPFPEPPPRHLYQAEAIKNSHRSRRGCLTSRKPSIKSTASKPSTIAVPKCNNRDEEVVSLKNLQSVLIPSSSSPTSKTLNNANNAASDRRVITMPGSEGHYNLISATIGSEAPRTPSQTSESPTNENDFTSLRAGLTSAHPSRAQRTVRQTISPRNQCFASTDIPKAVPANYNLANLHKQREAKKDEFRGAVLSKSRQGLMTARRTTFESSSLAGHSSHGAMPMSSHRILQQQKSAGSSDRTLLPLNIVRGLCRGSTGKIEQSLPKGKDFPLSSRHWNQLPPPPMSIRLPSVIKKDNTNLLADTRSKAGEGGNGAKPVESNIPLHNSAPADLVVQGSHANAQSLLQTAGESETFSLYKLENLKQKDSGSSTATGPSCSGYFPASTPKTKLEQQSLLSVSIAKIHAASGKDLPSTRNSPMFTKTQKAQHKMYKGLLERGKSAKPFSYADPISSSNESSPVLKKKIGKLHNQQCGTIRMERQKEMFKQTFKLRKRGSSQH